MNRFGNGGVAVVEVDRAADGVGILHHGGNDLGDVFARDLTALSVDGDCAAARFECEQTGTEDGPVEIRPAQVFVRDALGFCLVPEPVFGVHAVITAGVEVGDHHIALSASVLGGVHRTDCSVLVDGFCAGRVASACAS